MSKRPLIQEATEQREVTPQQRKAATRTFGILLTGFLGVVGVMVAWYSFQGNSLRRYGLEVVQAVQATKPAPQLNYDQACKEALPKKAPQGIKSCEVEVRAGQVKVKLESENGRLYVLPKE